MLVTICVTRHDDADDNNVDADDDDDAAGGVPGPACDPARGLVSPAAAPACLGPQLPAQHTRPRPQHVSQAAVLSAHPTQGTDSLL